jgi:MoaA/NifB/PqqE/SkfB family radical SAM enzyme
MKNINNNKSTLDSNFPSQSKFDWTKADWIDPKYNWKPSQVPEMPPRVLIDFALKCNLRCGMCPVWGNDDKDGVEALKGLMSLENARRLIDEIAVAKPLVHPCLYGEPLLAPNLKEHIRQIKTSGMTFAMNSNGLSLTDEMATILVDEGVDSVMISIDAISADTLKKVRGIRKLERIENAVFKMLKARGDKIKPRVGVSFTIQDSNRHELDDFVARWVGIVDVVRTGRIFENGSFQGLTAPKIRTACPVIYKTLPVHNDGLVTVCCLDGMCTTNMGNVFKTSVHEVWHGEEFTKMRYLHETGQWDAIPFCDTCNGWAQHEYQEEIRDGLLIRHSPEFDYYNKISHLANWQGSLLGGHEPPPPGL